MNNTLNYHLLEMITTTNKYLYMRRLGLGHCAALERTDKSGTCRVFSFHKTREDKTTPIVQSLIRCRRHIYMRDSAYMYDLYIYKYAHLILVYVFR